MLISVGAIRTISPPHIAGFGERKGWRFGSCRRQRKVQNRAFPVQISTTPDGRTCIQSQTSLGCTPEQAFQLVATAERCKYNRWPEWVLSSSYVESEGLLQVDATITEWFGLFGLRLFSTKWEITDIEEGKSLEIFGKDVLGLVKNVVLRFGMQEGHKHSCCFDFAFSWECANAGVMLADRLLLRFVMAVDTYIALLALKRLVGLEFGGRAEL